MSDLHARIGAVTTGTSVESIVEALDGVRPIVRLSPNLHPAARSAGVALFSTLLRAHPHAIIDGTGPLAANGWLLADVDGAAAAFAGAVPPPTRRPGRDVVIGIGDDVIADVYIGGDDWTASISHSPTPAAASTHGYGLHAAAALAHAQLLGEILTPFGFPSVAAPDPFVWNMVDYRLRAAPTVDLPAARARLELLICGAGSVGSSCVALLCAAEPGRATVVDPDTFDPTKNPYRYPAATNAVRGSKAEWAASMMRSAGWTAEAFQGSVAEWVQARREPGFDGIVLSSVDTVDGRADVADILGRTTLTAGVAGAAMHIQREHPADDAACPFCQFVNVARSTSQMQIYSEQTGIPLPRIAELLDGATLEVSDLDRALVSGKINAGAAPALVGRRLVDLIGRVYADVQVPSADGGALTVSAPFVSWFAGVLLAAEVNKLAVGLAPVDRRVEVDMTGSPSGVVRRLPSDPTGRCVCHSPVRRRWAKALYR